MNTIQAWKSFKESYAFRKTAVADKLDTISAQLNEIQTDVATIPEIKDAVEGDETAIDQANESAGDPGMGDILGQLMEGGGEEMGGMPEGGPLEGPDEEEEGDTSISASADDIKPEGDYDEDPDLNSEGKDSMDKDAKAEDDTPAYEDAEVEVDAEYDEPGDSELTVDNLNDDIHDDPLADESAEVEEAIVEDDFDGDGDIDEVVDVEATPGDSSGEIARLAKEMVITAESDEEIDAIANILKGVNALRAAQGEEEIDIPVKESETEEDSEPTVKSKGGTEVSEPGKPLPPTEVDSDVGGSGKPPGLSGTVGDTGESQSFESSEKIKKSEINGKSYTPEDADMEPSGKTNSAVPGMDNAASGEKYTSEGTKKDIERPKASAESGGSVSPPDVGPTDAPKPNQTPASSESFESHGDSKKLPAMSELLKSVRSPEYWRVGEQVGKKPWQKVMEEQASIRKANDVLEEGETPAEAEEDVEAPSVEVEEEVIDTPVDDVPVDDTPIAESAPESMQYDEFLTQFEYDDGKAALQLYDLYQKDPNTFEEIVRTDSDDSLTSEGVSDDQMPIEAVREMGEADIDVGEDLRDEGDALIEEASDEASEIAPDNTNDEIETEEDIIEEKDEPMSESKSDDDPKDDPDGGCDEIEKSVTSIDAGGKHIPSIAETLAMYKSQGRPSTRPTAEVAVNGDAERPELGNIKKSSSPKVMMGHGVDPAKVVENDWKEYNLFMSTKRY